MITVNKGENMRYLIILFLFIGAYAQDDETLVKQALANGLRPVPKSLEALVKVLEVNEKMLSSEKIRLGKKLFFEKELSLNKDISCASCHSFKKGGADAQPTAIGHKNRANPFHLNTPTVLNTMFSKNYFWNGRSQTLQEQAKGPLQAPFEMSITPDLAQKRVTAREDYCEMFEEVYGKDSITFDHIADAISAYEQTLVTHGRFDEFLLGDFNALTKEEKIGLNLFITKGCVGCHNGPALGGQAIRKFPLVYHEIWSMLQSNEVKALQKKYDGVFSMLEKRAFTNVLQKLDFLKSKLNKRDIQLLQEGFFNTSDHTTIVTGSCKECHVDDSTKIKERLKSTIAFPFENIGGFLGKDSVGLFRVPLLRNITQTAPYFHNGKIEKIEDAITLMAKHQSRSVLTDNEVKNLVAFLKAVDGEFVKYEY